MREKRSSSAISTALGIAENLFLLIPDKQKLLAQIMSSDDCAYGGAAKRKRKKPIVGSAGGLSLAELPSLWHDMLEILEGIVESLARVQEEETREEHIVGGQPKEGRFQLASQLREKQAEMEKEATASIIAKAQERHRLLKAQQAVEAPPPKPWERPWERERTEHDDSAKVDDDSSSFVKHLTLKGIWSEKDTDSSSVPPTGTPALASSFLRNRYRPVNWQVQ
jgi:hypothetical protein